MSENVIKLIIGMLLLICGIWDIKYKKIFLWLIPTAGVLISILIPFCSSSITIYARIGGVAVGAAIIILSLATGGKIGLGDGLLLCVTGLGLGFWENMELFAAALSLAAVISILLLMLRMADRKKAIPFVPFLFAGYMLLIFVNWKGTI